MKPAFTVVLFGSLLLGSRQGSDARRLGRACHRGSPCHLARVAHACSESRGLSVLVRPRWAGGSGRNRCDVPGSGQNRALHQCVQRDAGPAVGQIGGQIDAIILHSLDGCPQRLGCQRSVESRIECQDNIRVPRQSRNGRLALGAHSCRFRTLPQLECPVLSR